MLYLSNAFSLNMLNLNRPWNVSVAPVSVGEVKELISISDSNNRFVSAIGHQDLANILTNMLGIKIQYNRINIQITPNDTLIVAQYICPRRLAEGTTVLPESAQIQFVRLFIR